jgi:endonuclease/exonuclease/phosphatase family metal-dependent hydrolase
MLLALIVLCGAGGEILGSAHREQPSRPWGRPTAPLSDVLTHSELVGCPAGRRRQTTLLRVATWNIAAARYAPVAEIATELQKMRADIIALQEVDHRLRRTGFTDQPRTLAAALGFQYVFAASIKWDGGDYGLALLSRWPLVSVVRHRVEVVGIGEPRIVLEVIVCADRRPVRVFNHHADIAGPARHAALARLMEVVQPRIGTGVIVAGDLNAPPHAPGVRSLVNGGLVDVGAGQNEPTSHNGRIDYLLADTLLSKGLRRAHVWVTKKSDHHALVAEFSVE